MRKGSKAARGDASLRNIFPALPRHVVVLSRSPSLGSESLERSITRASSLARVATAQRTTLLSLFSSLNSVHQAPS